MKYEKPVLVSLLEVSEEGICVTGGGSPEAPKDDSPG